MFKQFFSMAVFLLILLPAQAQDGQVISYFLSYRDGIREFTGTLASIDDVILITLPRFVKGHTLYLFVQGGGDFDPVAVAVHAQNRDAAVAYDDNSGGGTNAMLQFTATKEGDYIIAIYSQNGGGDYRIVAGVNTPEVLQEAISDTTFSSEMSSASNFSCDTAEQAERPILSGTEQRLEAQNFVVHFTLEGDDATTQEYAVVLLVALDNSLRFQTEILGWALPPQDCGEGGDTRLDVYIMGLEDGLFGYAHNDNFVGDNPNTPGREVNAAYSHLVLDNDMIFENEEISIGPNEAILRLQSTAAHELHHNVQFGYDAQDFYYGFYEGGAAWIEASLYLEPQFIGQAAQSVFDYADVCIGGIGEEASPPRWYGEWVMIDSISRDLGQTAYRQIWEHLILEQGLTGFYNALAILGSTPQEVVKRMAIRNLLHDYALHQVFPGTVRLEATVTEQGQYIPDTTGVQELGVDYVRIMLPPGVYTFELAGRNLDMFLVGIDTATNTAQTFSLQSLGNVDIRPFTHTYLIILNTQQHIEPFDCTYTDWRLAVYDGSGSATTSADYEVWDSARFVVAE